MYTGKNPTAIRSQQWLGVALLALMRRKDYEKISIKEICQSANLSRQTFYQVFASKEEVVHYCVRSYFDDVIRQLEKRAFISVYDVISYFCRHLEENKGTLKIIFSHNLQPLLIQDMTAVLREFIDRVNPSDNPQTREYADAFFSAGLTNILFSWIQDPERISGEKLTKLLTEELCGSFFFPNDEVYYGSNCASSLK